MPVSRKRNPGYLLACGLIVTGLFFFLMSRSADAASGNSAYPAADKAEVEAKLRAKGKTPWIEREKGMGVMTLKSGGTLSEDFFPLDAYEAYSSVDLRDDMPKFAPGYDNQKGKADDISRALEVRLKKNLSVGFRALAGESKVDVVRLAEHGGVKAYVFVIPMGVELAAMSPDGKHFYYRLPDVLRTLEDFLAGQPALANVIWLERGENFFMFVVQRKK